MSRLPRLAPGAGVKDIREYLNLLASAIDAGGFQNIAGTVTDAGVTGQGMTQNFPPTPGSTNPQPGSSGAPNTPSGLILSYGIDHYHQTHDGYIVISWTPNPVSDNISRYDIYWRKGSDTNLHQLTVGGDVTAARINSVIPGLSYVFAIQAHDTSGRASNFSPEQAITISLDVDPPAVPTGLAATSTGSGVYLVWTEVGSEGISNDLKQYQIAVSLDGGSTYPNTYTIGPGNSYFYTPTTANQGTVFFKIASVDWTGNVSAYSSPVSATVGTILGPLTVNPGPLTITGSSAVGGLQLTSGNSGGGSTLSQLVFGWQGDSPAVHYPSFITTRHVAGAAAGNQMLFYTGDGTQAGVFPTNAVLGLTIDSSTGVTTAKALTVASGGLTITAGGETITAGDLTISAGLVQSNGATAGSFFNDRSGSGHNWGWYTSSDIARLWTSPLGDLITVDNTGLTTLRNALKIPPSTGGTVASTSYGSMPVKIDEVTLGGAQATITFNEPIPGNFRHLVVEWYARGDAAASINAALTMRFNNVSSATYNSENMLWDGSGSANMTTSETLNSTQGNIGWMPASSATAGYFGQGRCQINNYAGTTGNKLWYAQGNWGEGNTTLLVRSFTYTGFWQTTATAITRIDLIPAAGNFAAGSVFTLYGIP